MTEDDDTPPAEVPNLTLRLVRDTRADIAKLLRMMESMRADLGGVEGRLGRLEGRVDDLEHGAKRDDDD